MDICVLGLPKQKTFTASFKGIRSGKTSILKVIFQRMGPQYTMMLDPTTKIETIPKNFGSYFQINIYDFPGKYDLENLSSQEAALLNKCGAMIYVIDVQDESFNEAISYAIDCIKVVHAKNPKMIYNIFLHKTDAEAFSVEDKKHDFVQTIKTQFRSELDTSDLKNIHIDYHLTTVYDHTLIDSFSKVVQKIIPNISHIVSLLDALMTVY